LTYVAKISHDGAVEKVFGQRAVTDDWGIQHPSNIFSLWTDAELNAIGYARFDEQPIPSNKRSAGSTDTFADGRVYRSHAMRDFVPAADAQPGDEDYDHAVERKRLYPPLEELIVALWEDVVENRPDEAEALEEKRRAVKARFPKVGGI
jgi:hypothetical protein